MKKLLKEIFAVAHQFSLNFFSFLWVTFWTTSFFLSNEITSPSASRNTASVWSAMFKSWVTTITVVPFAGQRLKQFNNFI